MTPPAPEAPAPEESSSPRGDLALKISAMPANTNAAGDIFGGWIMGLMDMAAGNTAYARAQGRVATVAVSDLEFLRPVKVGDLISCYANIARVGHSSITIDIDVWVRRGVPPMHARVTHARFVMVAVDKDGHPRDVGPEPVV